MRSSKKQAKQITSTIMAIVMAATTTFQMPVIAIVLFQKKNVLNLKKKAKKCRTPIAASCSICHTYAERILRKI